MSATSASGLKGALGCLFAKGFAAVPRGAVWGLVLGLPAAVYCCVTLPYGGGLVAGPALALGGPVVGAWVAFHVGAAVGLFRAGHRWLVLLLPALDAAFVVPPYACYVDRQAKEAEYRRLVLQLGDQDPGPFLAQLRDRRSRGIVEDHLQQFLVCAGARSSPDQVVDALAALDPRGKEGVALCAVAQYGQPATVSHLLSEGYRPARAHRLDGQPCEPLRELAAGSTATSPCAPSMLGTFDQFDATPTPEGCRHRAQVAALLVEAGASTEGAPLELNGCVDGGAPADASGSAGD